MSKSDAAVLAPGPANITQQSVSDAFRSLKGRRLGIPLAALAVWSLTNMDQSLFGYAVPNILAEFHASLDAIGLILSVGFGLAIIFCIIIGLLTDRFGRRVMLAGCLGLSGLLVGLQSLAPTLVVLGAARAIAFAISAGLSPITNSIVAEAAPSRIRGLMIGFLQCGYPIGWFVASEFVVPLMHAYGWRSIFAIGFTIVPVALLFYWLMPESPAYLISKRTDEQRDWRTQLGELFLTGRAKQTLLIGLALFTQGGAYAGSAFYLPTFLHSVRGYDEATATEIVGHSYAIGIIGYIAVSLIGEFLLSRRTTIVLWCWTAALALTGMIWLPETPRADVVWCGLTAIFFYGSAAILSTYLLELFPTRLRATGAATGSAFLNLGFAIYPVVVARAVDLIGWQNAFTIFLVPSLFVCGLAVFGLKDIPSGRSIEELS